MSELDCSIITFNCARNLIDVDFFARTLHSSIASPSDPPDLLVLALEEVAPIAYSFLGGTYLAPYFARFEAAVDQLIDLCPGTTIRYEPLLQLNAGMTALMVFAQPDVARNISDLQTAAVRVGDYELGNKGAVGAQLTYRHDNDSGDDAAATPLTFVAAHLAPMEEAWERRNSDWADIARNMVFSPLRRPGRSRAGASSSTTTKAATDEAAPLLAPGSDDAEDTGDASAPSPDDLRSRSLYAPGAALFVAGDLNYRTADLRPHAGAHSEWPSPLLRSSGADRGPFAELWVRDQLSREMGAGNAFQGLREERVRFPPTYKYSEVAQRVAGDLARAEEEDVMGKEGEGLWAKHRVPSWCDRILYALPSAGGERGSGGGIEVGKYDALRIQPTSDHRPVVLSFKLSVGSLSEGTTRARGNEPVKAPYSISPDWAARRERSRRKDLAVGVLAYVTTTWEGNLVMLGTVVGAVGGWALIRSFI